MTIKEIAALLKLSDRAIQKRVEKLGEKCSPHFETIRKKLDNAIKGEPAELTIDETLAIVKAVGKNDALAALLAENAASKNAVTVQNEVLNRLDRIEKAVAMLALAINQPPNRVKRLPKSFEDSIKEADGFIAHYLEYTDNPSDWIHFDEIWTIYKRVEDHLKRWQFSNRLYKNEAERFQKYNKEAVRYIKFKDGIFMLENRFK